MKWQMMVTSLVLGLGISTQSFGFELLDQMLGIGGNGCDSKCCDDHAGCKVDPGCGVKHNGCCDKGRHRFGKRHGNGCCEPKCKVDPGCCVKDPGCCGKRRGHGCGVKHNGCCDKHNGCCDKPKSCCKKRRCLLDALFSCKRGCCDKGCDHKHGCEAKCKVDPGCCVKDPGCHVDPGCCGGHPVPAETKDAGPKAPMPPAPIVDPSAYVPSQRRVVQVSSTIIR